MAPRRPCVDSCSAPLLLGHWEGWTRATAPIERNRQRLEALFESGQAYTTLLQNFLWSAFGDEVGNVGFTGSIGCRQHLCVRTPGRLPGRARNPEPVSTPSLHPDLADSPRIRVIRAFPSSYAREGSTLAHGSGRLLKHAPDAIVSTSENQVRAHAFYGRADPCASLGDYIHELGRRYHTGRLL